MMISATDGLAASSSPSRGIARHPAGVVAPFSPGLNQA